MKLGSISFRRRWLVCVAVALATVIGLVVAGSQALMVREFALRVPNQFTVAQLRRSQSVCEGPVVSPGETSAVGIWGGSALGLAVVGVELRDPATGRRLAFGQTNTAGSNGYVVPLSRPVPAGRPVRICVTAILNTFELVGGAAVVPNVRMVGGMHGMQFSLVLDDNRTLLGSLSTAFSRASLWRPSWVGAWTFWLLAIALLCTFGIAVAAVVSADSRDDDERRDRAELEAVEDRPQPVL